MNVPRKKVMILIFSTLVFLLCLTPGRLVKAVANNKGTIYACYSSTTPTVDGHFSSGEWNSAGPPVDITLYDEWDRTNTVILDDVMALYTAQDMLYIRATSQLSTFTGQTRLMFYFHTNTGAPFLECAPNCTFFMENDVKVIWTYDNITEDGLTLEWWEWDNDENHGGTNDAQGACHPGVNIDFELAFPLDSGDGAGHDPALAVDSEIEMFTSYFDSGSGKLYWQIQEYRDYDYHILSIGGERCPTPAPGPIIIFGSLASVSAIAVIIHKKRKTPK